MRENHEAILKSLVALAWSDGHLSEEEGEVIEAMLSTFRISGADADMVREYAKSPRSIEDVPVAELSAEDRRTLLQHAVVLSYIDGEQDDAERDTLDDLISRLEIPEAEAKELMSAADERARNLLDVLS